MTICVSDREVMEQESEIVLSVERVSKKFCRDLKRSLFYGIQDITKELTGLRENSHKLRPHEFWAVIKLSQPVARLTRLQNRT